jgi:hypothetical protein
VDNDREIPLLVRTLHVTHADLLDHLKDVPPKNP